MRTGDIIKKRIKEKGVSIDHFAKDVNMHPSALKNILYNKSPGSRKSLHKIANSLGCLVTELKPEGENLYQDQSNSNEKFSNTALDPQLAQFCSTIFFQYINQHSISISTEKSMRCLKDLISLASKFKENKESLDISEKIIEWIIEKN